MAALPDHQRIALDTLHDAIIRRWTLDKTDEDQWRLEFVARVHTDAFFGRRPPAGLEQWPGSLVRVAFEGVVGISTGAKGVLMSGGAMDFSRLFEPHEWESIGYEPRLRPESWHGDRRHILISLSNPPIGVEIMFADVRFSLKR